MSITQRIVFSVAQARVIAWLSLALLLGGCVSAKDVLKQGVKAPTGPELVAKGDLFSNHVMLEISHLDNLGVSRDRPENIPGVIQDLADGMDAYGVDLFTEVDRMLIVSNGYRRGVFSSTSNTTHLFVMVLNRTLDLAALGRALLKPRRLKIDKANLEAAEKPIYPFNVLAFIRLDTTQILTLARALEEESRGNARVKRIDYAEDHILIVAVPDQKGVLHYVYLWPGGWLVGGLANPGRELDVETAEEAAANVLGVAQGEEALGNQRGPLISVGSESLEGYFSGRIHIESDVHITLNVAWDPGNPVDPYFFEDRLYRARAAPDAYIKQWGVPEGFEGVVRAALRSGTIEGDVTEVTFRSRCQKSTLRDALKAVLGAPKRGKAPSASVTPTPRHVATSRSIKAR